MRRSSTPSPLRRYIRMPALRFGMRNPSGAALSPFSSRSVMAGHDGERAGATNTLLVGGAGEVHRALRFGDDVGRHRVGAREDGVDRLAGDLLEIDVGLLGLGDETGVRHGGMEGRPQ